MSDHDQAPGPRVSSINATLKITPATAKLQTDLEAMEWLDRVRRTGLERRFTVKTDKDELEPLLKIKLSDDPPPPRIVSQG